MVCAAFPLNDLLGDYVAGSEQDLGTDGLVVERRSCEEKVIGTPVVMHCVSNGLAARRA